MKRWQKYLFVFLIFSFITFIYSFYIFQINSDEIWNYGFAHSIYTGLVPYRDFNMIIPPLFLFCVIPFFFLFGDSLITFHIFSSLIVGLSILFMYMKVGKKAFLVYPFIILGYLPSYNLFCVFLFSILTLVDKSENKYRDILLGIVVSLIFLTKQTVGVALLLPCLIYSKKRIKSLISFCIPILVLVIYLICNGALYNFIDYCFLGMFSFVSDNGSFNINLIIMVLLCLFLGYKLIKSKFKLSNYFYAIMFQIMVLPMGDNFHFFMASSVIIYVLLMEYDITKIKYIYLFIFIYITTILIAGIKAVNAGIEFNIYKDDGYFYGRNVRKDVYGYIANYENCLAYANKNGYDYLFVFSKNAYFLKLANDQVLNKFDLINNGNMGYKSYLGYIEDIESMCKDSVCMFIVEEYSDIDRGQTNINLLNYPYENYILKYSLGQFKIYKNERLYVK